MNEIGGNRPEIQFYICIKILFQKSIYFLLSGKYYEICKIVKVKFNDSIFGTEPMPEKIVLSYLIYN